MTFITAIYDRTLTDILNGTDKAFFNVLDWVRINSNTSYVRYLMNALKDMNIAYNVVDEPTIITIPSVEDINHFIENIEYLRSASGLSAVQGVVELKDDWLDITNAESPDYNDVNDWERNLKLIMDLTLSLSVYMMFCGVANCGQPRFWQNRFRDRFIHDIKNPIQRPRCGVAICGTDMMRQNNFRRYA
jgi:hypothetical protein